MHCVKDSLLLKKTSSLKLNSDSNIPGEGSFTARTINPIKELVKITKL
jgi:hypothetical protein